MRKIRILAGLALALSVVSAPALAKADQVWVRTISASPRNFDPAKAGVIENATVRMVSCLTLGGDIFRVRISNEHGNAPLKIGTATLVVKDGKTIRYVPITFGGEAGLSIAAGAPGLSDEITVSLKSLDVVELRLFFPEKAVMSTFHSDGRNPAEVSAPGDFTQTDFGTPVSSLRTRPFFSGIEVQASPKARTIVAFGDSITDGDCQIGPELCRWSEVLAERLQKAGKPYAVANQGIGGNRVLLDNTGISALARFDRDVLSLPNVAYVVMLEGINDIGNSGPPVKPAAAPAVAVAGTQTAVVPATPPLPDPPLLTAAEMIAGYKQIIARAHANGIKIYGAEILPFKGARYYSDDKEKVRLEVNQWIRTSGAFDGVVNFTGAVSDPADPSRLAPGLESGDHLHPNGAGQRAMGNAIDLGLFK